MLAKLFREKEKRETNDNDNNIILSQALRFSALFFR